MTSNSEAYLAGRPAPPQLVGGLFGGEPEFSDFGPDEDATSNTVEPDDGESIVYEETGPEAEPVGTVALRPHQEAAVAGIVAQYRQKINRTLVVAATGSGKSVMIAATAKMALNLDHGVLILVHRDELIRQLAKAVARTGVHPLIEKAEERALGGFGLFSKCVVASKDSMRGKRLEAWPKDAFRLCIIDEAHHALMGNGYGQILKYFGLEDRGLRVAGFTATADRLDGENIGQIFESLAFEYNIRAATKDGWLVPIEAVQLKTDPQIDLRDLRTTAGDFNQGDLEREVNENIGTLVNAIRDTNAFESRRTIAFTPNISSARALAEALTDVGISARAVAGADSDRHAKFKAHQNGEYQVLCNCAVATEGYDDPQIEAVLICRPTKSRALYSQMVGRGTRIYDNPATGYVKNNCRVVDFAFVTGKHKLVSPVDLYDNREISDEVVEEARELVASGEYPDVEMALEKAQEEYDERRRVKIQRRMVNVQASKFNPVDACEIYGIPQKTGYDWGNTTPATPKQVETLQKMGVEATAAMGKGVATALLNKMFARKEHGWANPWQVRDLIRSGVDPKQAVGMRTEAAASFLSANPLPPSEKQKKFLAWKGVAPAEIAGMTAKDATARIGEIKAAEG